MPEIKTKKGADKTYVAADKPFETDEFGKRKVDASTKRQIKAATGELPNSTGVPKTTGADEQAVFDKAHALIEKLKTSKEFDKDF